MPGSVVLSAIYPQAKPYILEFLSSLARQTDSEFSLFLVNDGLSQVESFLKEAGLDAQVLPATGTPTEIRKIGIEWVKSMGAETIIFADADDYFSPNRIEVSKKALADVDLSCNEILLVGEKIPHPISMFDKLEDKMKISKAHIKTGNCLGLSNTAIRVKCIPRSFETIPNSIIAFDWALFALCIHEGAQALFTKETQTYYRQHDFNVASAKCLTDGQIMRGVEVKKDHYQWLSETYKEYALLSKVFENLSVQLQNSSVLKERYFETVRQNSFSSSLWWEPIKTLEELGL